MKIIEALKATKSLAKKAEDLRNKIGQYSADLDLESPTYGTPEQQRQQVKEWLQSHHDVLREIERLRVGVARTNLATQVTIELAGKQVTKPIVAWIARRKELAALDMQAWQKLWDRNLKDSLFNTTSGQTREVKIRRYYDPRERDERVSQLRDEPSLIDAALEIVNATTDLIEG